LGAVKGIRERGDGGRWIDGERERERESERHRERELRVTIGKETEERKDRKEGSTFQHPTHFGFCKKDYLHHQQLVLLCGGFDSSTTLFRSTDKAFYSGLPSFFVFQFYKSLWHCLDSEILVSWTRPTVCVLQTLEWLSRGFLNGYDVLMSRSCLKRYNVLMSLSQLAEACFQTFHHSESFICTLELHHSRRTGYANASINGG